MPRLDVEITLCLAQAFHGQKELFKSEHCDWCFASTIESKCRVHSLQAYQVLFALTLSRHHVMIA